MPYLTVQFAAMAGARHLQEITGISIMKLVQTLKLLRTVTIKVNGHGLTTSSALYDDIQKPLGRWNSSTGH